MQQRTLGDSEIAVSAIGFGAWQMADPKYWGEDDAADADATLRTALDAGITLFDTAEFYGDGLSEQMLGKALGKRRSEVVIASKIWPTNCLSPDTIRERCERSLEMLGTDYIDLYQVHWPTEAPDEMVFSALRALKEEGKVREIGISNFGPTQIEAWCREGAAVSNQLAYNLLFRAIEFDIVPACQKHAMGILAYVPVMQGLLAGRYESVDDIPPTRRRTRHFSSAREGTRHGEPGAEDLLFESIARIREIADDLGEPMAAVALAWAMRQPSITSALIGARKPEQLTENLRAADIALDDDTLARLDAATTDLKDALGPNADMWLAGDEARVR